MTEGHTAAVADLGDDEPGFHGHPSGSIGLGMTQPPAAERPMPQPTAPAIRATGLPKLTRIVLEENDNIPPTGQPIGINGRTFILQPGIEADVPEVVLQVLDDAVMDSPIIDPQTRRITGWRKKLRFPYTVVRR